MAEKRVYGIDLGTTYSCISYVDEHGKPVVIPNSQHQLTTPSVVNFEQGGNVVVGQSAKDDAAVNPARVISTVKRMMGDPDWTTNQDGRDYTPQEVSSFILKQLAQDASAATGQKVEEVVITCPAYFGLNQKEATKQAGELAGLNVLYVIPEPTAAAVAYGMEQSQEQVVLVYDLGGGTFDITLIKISPAEIRVICTGGDHQLGGINWDEALLNYVVETFAAEHGKSAEDVVADPATLEDLRKDVEQRKQALSTRAATTFKVSFGGERGSVEVTREKFDALTAGLLGRTLSLTEELIETARSKGFSRIDKILLVGGSTYMPQVIEAVKRKFPFEVLQFEPNQAVAKGAALYGYSCYLKQEILRIIEAETGTAVDDPSKVDPRIREAAERKVAELEGVSLPVLRTVNRPIVNVSSKSFGIVVVDPKDRVERVQNLVVVDQEVPVTSTQVFSTIEEDQSGVLLRCIESIERKGPNDGPFPLDPSQQIGQAELKFARDLPAGSKVELSFTLQADGLLKLFGRDLTTYSEIVADFQTSSIISREELEKKKKVLSGITVSG